jgi:hypothetical protein
MWPVVKRLSTPILHTRQLYADAALYQRALVHLREKMPVIDEDRQEQIAALTAETTTLEEALASFGERFSRAREAARR